VISTWKKENKVLRRFGLIVVLVLVSLFVSARPGSAARATITLDFQYIRQGEVGVVRVSGADITDVRAVFQERVVYFYPENNVYVGLVSADMDSKVELTTMQVWVQYADGTSEQIDQPIQINYGEFGRWEVTIPASLAVLLEPEVNEAEMAKLFNIFERFTPERYWAGGFDLPNTAEQIAWFGTWRLYNGTYWYRHTGIDVRVGVGTSVNASASGRVILAQEIPIRGNYVLIDHGWGVYTGYAHNSQLFVVPGEWVEKGQVIALSGMTGRSGGAHIHWEMAVGGVWVDPLDFLALGLNVITSP
jgi:murein DD-endopeptidase MepM/ murein hydrolase activator NlpD